MQVCNRFRPHCLNWQVKINKMHNIITTPTCTVIQWQQWIHFSQTSITYQLLTRRFKGPRAHMRVAVLANNLHNIKIRISNRRVRSSQEVKTTTIISMSTYLQCTIKPICFTSSNKKTQMKPHKTILKRITSTTNITTKAIRTTNNEKFEIWWKNQRLSKTYL